MGFFSFNLADTGEVVHRNTKCYILSHNENLTASYYDEYGNFTTNKGVINIFEWLAGQNYPGLKLCTEEMRQLGIALQCPDEPLCFRDVDMRYYTTLPLSVVKQLGIAPVKSITDFGLEIELEEVRASINDHIEANRLLAHPLKVPHPLKIAKVPQPYSELPTSTVTY